MFNPFSIITSKIFAGLAALFFLGFVTQTIRIEGFWFIVGFKEQNAILRLDLSKIQAAQLVAGKLAEEQKRRDMSAYNYLAERTDNAEREIAQLRSAADRYARAHRVRTKASGGASSGAGGTSAPGVAQGDNGPGANAGILVSEPDFNILVNNTIRLKKANDWGQNAIATGLAVPAE